MGLPVDLFKHAFATLVPTIGRPSLRRARQVPAGPAPAVAGPNAALDALARRPRTGEIVAPRPTAPGRALRGAGERELRVAKGADGRVTLSTPPPRIGEITFSGGGGKGAALPGAVAVLLEEGVVDGCSKISGASVGAMTAALVACGVTADEFRGFGNDPAVTAQIMQGKGKLGLIGAALGHHQLGEGLQAVVREKTGGTLIARIAEHRGAKHAAGEEVAPAVERIAANLRDRGPTFGELRELSAFMPSVKELSVSASWIAELDPSSREVVEHSARPQIVIFSADTEPDVEVAVAVRASAALPPVFAPVDILLASGLLVRFQDGGVLNNAPNADTLNVERDLDPIPASRGLTFIFEDDGASKRILKGEAKPVGSKVKDLLTGAENSAAEYGLQRALADHPEDVVEVPLAFTRGGRSKDFRGLISGTVNFGIEGDDKAMLQELSADATRAHLAKRRQPRPTEFASDEEMLMSVPLADLEALARQEVDGADDALTWRRDVVAGVTAIVERCTALARAGDLGADPDVLGRLDALKQQASSAPRQAVLARELNRHPRLDGLIDALRRGPAADDPTLAATFAVNEGIAVKARASFVLREVVYPKLTDDDEGPDASLLLLVDARLRKAASTAELNEALELAIGHFRGRGRLGRVRDASFADALAGYRMSAPGARR